jgi:transcriptional regulator with XRE-family HTH domain
MINSIGERIRDRRKMLGLSVDELAETIGKNRATIYRYESNEIENMSITILEPLAKALHTTPAELCGWDYVPPDSILSSSEKILISDFRQLNPAGQTAAAAAVKSFTQMDQFRKDTEKIQKADAG